MTTLDRYILRQLVTNYVISLAVMISLYVVLDMFVNMDEFTEQGYPAHVVLRNMVDYYFPNTLLYFAQLSGMITVFACLSVLARLRRQNELTAILSSGVSLYRVAMPIIVFGGVSIGLLVLDTEVAIPSVAHKLARDHDDVDGLRTYEVLFLRDASDRLLSARRFDPGAKDLHGLLILERDDSGKLVATIEADRATWHPPDLLREQGHWALERGRRTARVTGRDDSMSPRGGIEVAYPNRFVTNLGPDEIQTRQSKGWLRFLSLSQLEALEAQPGADFEAIARTRHARTTQPFVGLVLLLLGLPFFLDRSPGNIIADAGRCMLLCGACYMSSFVAQSLQTSDSALASWIPIFIFGTLSAVLLDRVRT